MLLDMRVTFATVVAAIGVAFISFGLGAHVWISHDSASAAREELRRQALAAPAEPNLELNTANARDSKGVSIAATPAKTIPPVQPESREAQNNPGAALVSLAPSAQSKPKTDEKILAAPAPAKTRNAQKQMPETAMEKRLTIVSEPSDIMADSKPLSAHTTSSATLPMGGPFIPLQLNRGADRSQASLAPSDSMQNSVHSSNDENAQKTPAKKSAKARSTKKWQKKISRFFRPVESIFRR